MLCDRLVKLGMNRDAKGQNAVCLDALFDRAVGEQLARRHDILDARHFLPVRMQGVVGDDADGGRGQQRALFEVVHQLCGEDVGAYNGIRRKIVDHAGKFGRAQRVDDVDDGHAGGKIAAAAVFR